MVTAPPNLAPSTWERQKWIVPPPIRSDILIPAMTAIQAIVTLVKIIKIEAKIPRFPYFKIIMYEYKQTGCGGLVEVRSKSYTYHNVAGTNKSGHSKKV